MRLNFTPLPSDPADLTLAQARAALGGDPARVLATIVRENNRRAIQSQSNTQTVHQPLEAAYGAKTA